MANMYFGFSCFDMGSGEPSIQVDVRSAACWASLKFSNQQNILTEVTWCPNKGHSAHVKLLLPLLFPDIEYEEVKVSRSRGSQVLHYGVRFTGLEKVYRNNFMFRMFAIRNIDRDSSCTKTFDYLLRYGMNPLMALAVAANTELRFGFGAENCTINKKGYAKCMGNSVTVADVRAFARNPHKAVNKTDQLFQVGGGYGYKYDKNGCASYVNDAAELGIKGYKATNPQFVSKSWGIPTTEFLFALTKDKHFLDPSLGSLIYKGL